MFAAVGMLFTACNKEADCGHEFIEYDYSKDLVGTWTCLDMDYAEALVIKADGSVEVTGVVDGEYFETTGTIQVKNNKMIYKLDNGDEWEGRFEMTAGESFTMVWDDEFDIRYTYRYCENDLADEIVGMWVCNDKNNGVESNMAINTYREDGTMNLVGVIPNAEEYMVNITTNYKVVGNLLFTKRADVSATSGADKYVSARLDYTPNGNAFGDILTFNQSIIQGDGEIENTSTYLRIKQNLELPGTKYDYRATYISNVKGEDKDIPFMNTSFNFAKMDGSIIDKFLKATLFAVEFPDANTLKYNFLLGGEITPMTAPIEVEDNKMTIKMSVTNPAYQDVVVYAFQDQDNTQMHLYMPTSSFEKFFANASVHMMLSNGQLNENDTEAIAGVYQSIADAVESINLSLVMSKSK